MNPPLPISQPAKVHFIGIGGLAMAGLASALHTQGWHVTGSDDIVYGVALSMLEKSGLIWTSPCAAENISRDTDIVIIGASHIEDNPEFVAARSMGKLCLTFPEFLAAWFPATLNSVLVAGTNGKTSTTAMLLGLLLQSGIKPSYLIGGSTPGVDRTLSLCNRDLAVFEADESRCARWLPTPKFHLLPATSVVLTSLAPDHPECYATEKDYFAAFSTLLESLPAHGFIIAHQSDLAKLGNLNPKARIITPDANGFQLLENYKSAAFLLLEKEYYLGLAGSHSARNAALAILAANMLGLEIDAGKFLAQFQGVVGRHEIISESPIPVIFDEGYHPDALDATLAATRQRYPLQRVHLVFRPRYLENGENYIMKLLPEALQSADVIHIFPEETLRDAPIPIENEFKSKQIVSILQTMGCHAIYQNDINTLIQSLRILLQPDDLLLICLPANIKIMVDTLLQMIPTFPAFQKK